VLSVLRDGLSPLALEHGTGVVFVLFPFTLKFAGLLAPTLLKVDRMKSPIALLLTAWLALPLAADRFAPPSHTIAVHPVAPGDRIYAFSDGLIEIRDQAQQMIGFDRMLGIARSGSASTIFDRFLACIPDETEYDDDVSLIEVIV